MTARPGILLSSLVFVLATAIVLSAVPAPAAPNPNAGSAGGCPNANGIASRLTSGVASVHWTLAAGTYTFYVDATDRGAVDGEPGIIAYCVYPADALPDAWGALYVGAIGPWTESGRDGYFAYVRTDGNPNNIPFDGTTDIAVGDASFTGSPGEIVVLLHIQDPEECTDLYGGGDSCFVFPEGVTPPPPGEGDICGEKFYDADTDGVHDADEVGIAGWKVELYDADGFLLFTVFTDPDGAYCFTNLPDGTYTVVEVFPPEGVWVATIAAEFEVVLPPAAADVSFGNVCLGPGGGRTLGYWARGPGRRAITEDDLSALRVLHLVDADGNDFDPATVAELTSWMTAADAHNMAYMLAAQLAAMTLNVRHGFVDGDALVYDGSGFLTVDDLMAQADAALADDGYTPPGDPNREGQEGLKDTLDAANNDESFVQDEPCEFTTPY